MAGVSRHRSRPQNEVVQTSRVVVTATVVEGRPSYQGSRNPQAVTPGPRDSPAQEPPPRSHYVAAFTRWPRDAGAMRADMPRPG